MTSPARVSQVDWAFLKSESDAEEGSFILALRCDLRWDQERFTKLEQQMRLACAELHGERSLERWLVAAFWTWTSWVPKWTEHPNFPRPDVTYYAACMARLEELAMWFFDGCSPYDDGHMTGTDA